MFKFREIPPMPKFNLNLQLLKKLMAERGSYPLPELIFKSISPIAVLGTFSLFSNIITIDNWKIWAIAWICNINNPDLNNLNEKFREQITMILAHEVGHWDFYFNFPDKTLKKKNHI